MPKTAGGTFQTSLSRLRVNRLVDVTGEGVRTGNALVVSPPGGSPKGMRSYLQPWPVQTSARVTSPWGTSHATGMTLREPIPFGHKVALRAIRRGETVIEYGEVIGLLPWAPRRRRPSALSGRLTAGEVRWHRDFVFTKLYRSA